uniref:EF-hand domain-containing protein n=1 Tax=Parastrongyloides trichosuri TaxID=131310 RepID=A0A0N4Z758_PARTI
MYSTLIIFLLPVILPQQKNSKQKKFHEEEIENLFANLSTFHPFGNPHIEKEKAKISNLAYNKFCEGLYTFSTEIGIEYLDVYFYVDKYIYSQDYTYQIICAMKLLFSSRTNELIIINAMEDKDITQWEGCGYLRMLVGKSKKNQIHFFILGIPTYCKNFYGLGLFVILSPLQHGRPYHVKRTKFPHYRKHIINYFNELPGEIRLFKTIKIDEFDECANYHEDSCYHYVENKTDISTLDAKVHKRDNVEVHFALSIQSHFSHIYEIIQIHDDVDGMLNLDDLRSALKIIFIFANSQYELNLDIIHDKSSVTRNLQTRDDFDREEDNKEFAEWILTSTTLVFSFTVIIGLLVGGTIFMINNSQNKEKEKEKEKQFEKGIQIANPMLSDSDDDENEGGNDKSTTSNASTTSSTQPKKENEKK